jgi:hypothetical protein
MKLLSLKKIDVSSYIMKNRLRCIGLSTVSNMSESVIPSWFCIGLLSDEDTGPGDLTECINTEGSCITHHINPDDGGRDSLQNIGK